MKTFTKLITFIFLTAHAHNVRACQDEIKDIIPKFSTQKEKTMDKPFEKHFYNPEEDTHFLKANILTLNKKDYLWHIHDDHRKILYNKQHLHSQVLDKLNELENISFKKQDKIIGFSLGVCGEEVFIQPFLGHNAP